jgi:hypothetical protein
MLDKYTWTIPQDLGKYKQITRTGADREKGLVLTSPAYAALPLMEPNWSKQSLHRWGGIMLDEHIRTIPLVGQESPD